MIDKANKAVLILEVPDLEKKEESENTRKSMLSEEEYEEKYRGLNHLYYSRHWFYDQGRKKGLKINVFNQKINNYGNSEFRFNCIMEK